MRMTLASASLASLLISACSAPPAAQAPGAGVAPLAGSRWTLQALGDRAATRPPAVTLNFGADGRISGNDGCNPFGGSYSADAGSLRIAQPLAGTLMACPEPVESRARAYRAALTEAARYAASGTGLTLQDAAGRPLASFAPAPSSPVGATWNVIAYNNGRQGVVSLIIGTRATVRFERDGRVNGEAGCNRYFASYTLEGESLGIGPAGATRKFCAEPDGLMRQETMLLEALRMAASFRIEGDRLELRGADGALAMTLDRASEQ